MTVCVAGPAAIAGARWFEQKLYLNGKIASTDILMHNGVAYVPIRDVAAALSMNLQKRPDGYAIGASGGANQVGGINGRVGDDLFNGEVRLKVIDVVRSSAYKRRFSRGEDI